MVTVLPQMHMLLSDIHSQFLASRVPGGILNMLGNILPPIYINSMSQKLVEEKKFNFAKKKNKKKTMRVSSLTKID